MHISHRGEFLLCDIKIFTIPAYTIPKMMFKLQNCFPLGKLQMRADFLFGLLCNTESRTLITIQIDLPEESTDLSCQVTVPVS